MQHATAQQRHACVRAGQPLWPINAAGTRVSLVGQPLSHLQLVHLCLQAFGRRGAWLGHADG